MEPGAVTRDNHAFVSLDTFALAVLYLDHDTYGVTWSEFRNGAARLKLLLVLFLELLDDIHRSGLSVGRLSPETTPTILFDWLNFCRIIFPAAWRVIYSSGKSLSIDRLH